VDTRRAIARLMGGASLGLGLVGAVKPSLPARLTGASEDEARELGFRDLVVGIGICLNPRLGLVQRAIADLGDAVVFARRKRAVSVIAVVSAAIAALAAAGK
jgi:hypothetical protein